MEGDFKYYAFISYSHQDEKWAKWLHGRLLHFRLPSVARKEAGDMRINPIFRYVTNMPISHLREQITRELEASKYLIVVCSPNSARPNIRGEHWVNDEVRHFIKMGRRDYIIPVIVGGTPKSGGDDECFAPAILESEIVGADLRHGSRKERNYAFLKVVAKLLGLDPAMLIRFVDEEGRRKRLFRWLKLLPLALLLLVGGIFAWDFLSTTSRYYADYVDSFGLPEGKFEVTKSDLGQRSSTYRFDYCGYYFGGVHERALPRSWFGFHRKLKRVVHVGPKDVPQEEKLIVTMMRPVIQEFEYDNNDGLNRLSAIRVRSRGGSDYVSGPILYKINFSCPIEDGVKEVNGLMGKTMQDGTRPYFAPDQATQQHIADRYEYHAPITRYRIRRNSRGRKVSEMFMNSDLEPTTDANGVAGFRYDLVSEEDGRVKSITYLDAKGVQTSDRSGVMRMNYERTGHNVTTLGCEDANGVPTRCRLGFVKLTVMFDAHDNITNEVYRNASGIPTRRHVEGADAATEISGINNWSIASHEYTDGLETCFRIFEPDGTPPSQPGQVAIVRREYDERGDHIGRWFYDCHGKPVRSAVGCAYEVSKMDSQSGKLVSDKFYDVDGKTPVYDVNGVHEYRYSYDERSGMLIEVTFYDEHGSRICSRMGNAIIRYRVEDGKVVWMCYYDAESNACSMAEYGGNVACVTREYGKYDNPTYTRYFADERATVRARSADGSSGYHDVFDDLGRLVEHWAIDTDDSCLTQRGDDVTNRHIGYDTIESTVEVVPGYFAERGWRIVDTTFYVDKTTLAGEQNGWCTERYIYDDKGRLVFKIFLDAADNRVNDRNTGVCVEYGHYGHTGNQDRLLFFDSSGRPTLNAETDVAGSAFVTDPDTGLRVSETFLDLDFRTARCLTNEVFSQTRFDQSTVNVTRTSFWHDGEPKCLSQGYHEVVEEDDIFGSRTSETYFNELHEPCSRVFRGTVNTPGYVSEISYHRAVQVFDDAHNPSMVLRYDVDGRLMQDDNERFCAHRNEFDALRRLVAEYFIRVPEDPTVTFPTYDCYPGCRKDGVSRITYEYFGNSRMVRSRTDFALPGVTGLEGVSTAASCRHEFDELGRERRISIFGADGQPVASDTGISAVEILYDNLGRMSKRRFLDCDGKELKTKD